MVVVLLLAPPGSLPQLGSQELLASERLLVDAQGKLVSIALCSLKGDAQQTGDAMVLANLPGSNTVDGLRAPGRPGHLRLRREPCRGPGDGPLGRGASA